MARAWALLLVAAAGCQGPELEVAPPYHRPVPAAPPGRPTPGIVPAAAMVPAPTTAALSEVVPAVATTAARVGRLDLPVIWDLALVNNPALREAAADVEAARGRLMQARLYPNPRFLYANDTIGSPIARAGNASFEVNQEIVTGGKRRLDMAVASRETDAAALGQTGRKFDALTRVRRAYYDHLALQALYQEYDDIVAALERGMEVTRQLVEVAKTRPKTDLIRLEALHEEAKINRDRTRDSLAGVWRQLAAEVGVTELPAATEAGRLPAAPPAWDDAAVVKRVLTTNSALQQAATEADRARLAVERAQAGAVPNVTVGGGFNLDRTDQTSGGVVTVETALPVWNRQQGAVYEARAKLGFAQAAIRSAETRLSRETADALARYRAAARQVARLEAEVLPRLRESVDLTLKAYQAGSAQATFTDVLTTEQNLLTARVTLAEARRSLWQAVADLEGLMQVDVGEESALTGQPPPAPAPKP